MAAVLLYFRTELTEIARAWIASLRKPEFRTRTEARLGWYIILGTIPISVFGVAFRDQIEGGARSLYLMGITLIVLGLILYLAERVAALDRDLRSLNGR